jgi:hypothetical protein
MTFLEYPVILFNDLDDSSNANILGGSKMVVAMVVFKSFLFNSNKKKKGKKRKRKRSINNNNNNKQSL